MYLFEIVNRIFIVFIISVYLSGCGVVGKVIEHEKTRRGGVSDYVADKVFIANSKSMRVLRGYVFLAALSGIATEAGLDADARKTVSAQISETGKRLESAALCLRRSDKCIYFDNRMLDVDQSLFRLAVTILPVKTIRKLTVKATTQNIGAISALWDLSGQAFRSGLRLGALYRDGWEMYARVTLSNISRNSKWTNNGLKDFRNQFADGEGELAVWQKTLKEWRENNRNAILMASPEHFESVAYEIKINCGKLAANKRGDTIGRQITEACENNAVHPDVRARAAASNRNSGLDGANG